MYHQYRTWQTRFRIAYEVLKVELYLKERRGFELLVKITQRNKNSEKEMRP